GVRDPGGNDTDEQVAVAPSGPLSKVPKLQRVVLPSRITTVSGIPITRLAPLTTACKNVPDRGLGFLSAVNVIWVSAFCVCCDEMEMLVVFELKLASPL